MAEESDDEYIERALLQIFVILMPRFYLKISQIEWENEYKTGGLIDKEYKLLQINGMAEKINDGIESDDDWGVDGTLLVGWGNLQKKLKNEEQERQQRVGRLVLTVTQQRAAYPRLPLQPRPLPALVLYIPPLNLKKTEHQSFLFSPGDYQAESKTSLKSIPLPLAPCPPARIPEQRQWRFV
ncbi:hypothetical protein DINM_005194 [Dirofilaria immitis]|nr:hypothetical protein [Dirofilaria immitis]